MNEPTEEQIKEFWEWCGFEYKSSQIPVSKRFMATFDAEGKWLTSGQLPIDPNNLFKYAVPKIIGDGFTLTFEHALAEEIWYWWIIEKDDDLWKFSDKDPALALFWAIYEVVKST